MGIYDLEKEKKDNDYRNVFEEEHGNTKFLMRSAVSYVVDDYDELIDSVEQSHYEDLNYNEVIDFNKSEPDTTLDLTWMKKEDVFQLRNSEQYLTLNEIVANIDNLADSKLPSSNNVVNLKVSALNSKINFIDQIKSFKNFVSNNEVNSISFTGFNKAVDSILQVYAKKAGISVNKDDLTNGIQRHK